MRRSEEVSGRVRKANADDVPAMVGLSEQKRSLYSRYQPVFWAMAHDANTHQRTYFEQLVEDERTIALVNEGGGAVDGFVIARLVAAPPVYAPGGLTCSIDDFWVLDADEWPSVGKALMAAAVAEARTRGAAQTVVVCGQRDGPKREMLRQIGFSVASEWWVRAP
jgi:ribosomal protein S18 acetylase RimI-like enzyme